MLLLILEMQVVVLISMPPPDPSPWISFSCKGITNDQYLKILVRVGRLCFYIFNETLCLVGSDSSPPPTPPSQKKKEKSAWDTSCLPRIN